MRVIAFRSSDISQSIPQHRPDAADISKKGRILDEGNVRPRCSRQSHHLFSDRRAVAEMDARAVGHGRNSVFIVVYYVRGRADKQCVDLPQSERRDRYAWWPHVRTQTGGPRSCQQSAQRRGKLVTQSGERVEMRPIGDIQAMGLEKASGLLQVFSLAGTLG